MRLERKWLAAIVAPGLIGIVAGVLIGLPLAAPKRRTTDSGSEIPSSPRFETHSSQARRRLFLGRRFSNAAVTTFDTTLRVYHDLTLHNSFRIWRTRKCRPNEKLFSQTNQGKETS